MPGQWTSIETNFPTFTGEEPVEERLSALYNYMYIMTEQLKYNLSNLNSENFNATALQQLTQNASTEAANAVAAELEKIAAQYTQINARVEGLSGSMASLQRRVTEIESAQGGIDGRVGLLEAALSEEGDFQKRLRTLEEDVPLLEGKISGEDGLEGRVEAAEKAVTDLQVLNDETAQEVEALKGAMDVAEDAVTLGNQEKELRLIGKVYINGVLFQPEEQVPEEEEGTE